MIEAWDAFNGPQDALGCSSGAMHPLKFHSTFKNDIFN